MPGPGENADAAADPLQCLTEVIPILLLASSGVRDLEAIIRNSLLFHHGWLFFPERTICSQRSGCAEIAVLSKRSAFETEPH